MDGKQALEAERIQGFVDHAIGTHHEAAQLKIAIDLGAKPTLRESDDGERVELHLVHEDRADSLLIADIPAVDLMPTQN